MIYCRHIYEEVKFDPCEYCGKDSHKINWDFIASERRRNREEKGLFYTVREWWSI